VSRRFEDSCTFCECKHIHIYTQRRARLFSGTKKYTRVEEQMEMTSRTLQQLRSGANEFGGDPSYQSLH
jgi:hypothetical protein